MVKNFFHERYSLKTFNSIETTLKRQWDIVGWNSRKSVCQFKSILRVCQECVSSNESVCSICVVCVSCKGFTLWDVSGWFKNRNYDHGVWNKHSEASNQIIFFNIQVL